MLRHPGNQCAVYTHIDGTTYVIPQSNDDLHYLMDVISSSSFIYYVQVNEHSSCYLNIYLLFINNAMTT